MGLNVLDAETLTMIKQSEIQINQIDWSNLADHQLDVLTAEVRDMCFAAASAHVVLRKRALVASKYYFQYRRVSHFFARKQATNTLKINANRLKALINNK